MHFITDKVISCRIPSNSFQKKQPAGYFDEMLYR